MKLDPLSLLPHSPTSNQRFSSHARNVPCLMKESDLVRRSTWSSVWHIAHRARFSRERNRRVIHAAHWQACRKQRHSPTHNYFSKPEETRGWESRHYSVGSPRYFFFFLIWAILCHQAKYPKWHHSYNMMATIVQQVPLSFRIGEASLPIENFREQARS